MIKIIDKYLNKLKVNSNNSLNEKMKLSNEFSEFEKLNFFLINQSIEKSLNLFIKNIEFQDNSSFYAPLLKSISLSLFLKNYYEDKTSYEIGDILIDKDGKTFELIEKNQKKVILIEKSNKRSKHGDTKYTKNENDLKSYLILNKNESSDRKLTNSLYDYRKFFKEHFDLSDDYVPSKFSHKAVIILEKTEFLQELKGNNILKQIPVQWVTKDGGFEKTIIPIDPMIYLTTDYESFKENIFNKDFNIETIILLGSKKYKDSFNKIIRDLREKNIKNIILIGSEETEEIRNNENILKWCWTYTEYSKLNNFSLPEIYNIPIENDIFSKSISDYESYLIKLENDFSIDLKPLFKNLFLFSLVFPDLNNSRFKNKIEYIKNLKLKEVKSLIEEKLFSQNRNPEEYVNKSIDLINKIFSSFENRKFKQIKNISKNSTLIIPDSNSDIWESYNLKDIKILKLKYFYTKLENPEYKRDKNIFFLSLFSYSNPSELIFKLLQTSHKYEFLSYPIEAEILEKLKSHYFNNNLKQYNSEDRKNLTNIDFEELINNQVIEIKNTSDVIEEINLNFDNQKYYDNQTGEQVNYKIKFQDNLDYIILDGSKSVLIKSFDKINKIKVYDLLKNDTIRIYQNVSKNTLFDIAVSEDKNGRFSEIDNHSKLWKKSFINYSNSLNIDLESLLIKLKNNGSGISNIATLKKWLDLNDKEKFPKSLKDLDAVRLLVNDINLSQNFESIKKSRRLFRSIMISLGRDLSDQVYDYIISLGKNDKGNLLSKFSNQEIESFIKESAPLRKIIQIEITEEDENA